MAITQIGVATTSEELLTYIREMIKGENPDFGKVVDWNDLTDTPEYSGQQAEDYLQLRDNGNGGVEMIWKELPPLGLNWVIQDSHVTAEDKVGYLARGGITITLPDDAIFGSVVVVADRNGEFDEIPVTVVTEGSDTIEGAEDLEIDLRNAYIQLVYDGSNWHITQVNHPFNVQEITEESFPGGQLEYLMSRIPPSRAAILVTEAGVIKSTDRYTINGNRLIFGTPPVEQIHVRHIGVPAADKVSDVPVGGMMYFPNTSPTDGWLDCNGATINRSSYPDLVRYLTKDPLAETAVLPDPRGTFIRTFDGGKGIDTTTQTNLPTSLLDNTWGEWLDTADSSTIRFMWDGNTSTRTTVDYLQKYVGYRFDVPVRMTSADIYCDDAVGTTHLPTGVQLKASTDGVNWVDASTVVSGGAALDKTTTRINSNNTGYYRYWAVFGTGGNPYPGTNYFWGIASLTFDGNTLDRPVGTQQDGGIGPVNLRLGGQAAGRGDVASGTGAQALVVGGTGNVSGGTPDTRPSNYNYVLRIKAFSIQGSQLAGVNVADLQRQIDDLKGQIASL